VQKDLNEAGPSSTSVKKRTVAEKWRAAAPFHFFMTNVPKIPDTLEENLSIGLSGKKLAVKFQIKYYFITI